jgi:hypothetical protein
MEPWVIVRNYQEFVNSIKENYAAGKFPELISFDHDLAEVHYDPNYMKETFSYTEETGADCAKFVVQFCLDNNLELPKYYIHSANPGGSDNINQNLQDYYRYKERF